MRFPVVVFAAFWMLIVRLWLVDGPRIPMMFIAIWIPGALAPFVFGIGGYYFFLVYHIVLTIVLMFVDWYQEYRAA